MKAIQQKKKHTKDRSKEKTGKVEKSLKSLLVPKLSIYSLNLQSSEHFLF